MADRNIIFDKIVDHTNDVNFGDGLKYDALSGAFVTFDSGDWRRVVTSPYSIESDSNDGFFGGDKTVVKLRGEHSLDIAGSRDEADVSYLSESEKELLSSYIIENIPEFYAQALHSTTLGSRNMVLSGSWDGIDGIWGTAVGHQNVVAGKASSAFGNNNIVEQYWSTCVGDHNHLAHWSSRAFGAWQILSGGDNLGVGQHNKTYGWRNMAIGNFNSVSGIENQAFGSNNIIYEAPDVDIGETPDDLHYRYGQCFGFNNEVSGDGSTSMGVSGSVFGTASLAIGAINTVEGNTSMSFGINNEIIGNDSSAIGTSNIVYALSGRAYGSGNEIYGDSSIAVGVANEILAPANGSLSLGTHNISRDLNTIAIGDNNNVSGDNSVAIGDSNVITASGAFVLGSGVTNSHTDSIEIGPDDDNKMSVRSNGMFIFPPIPIDSLPTETELATGHYSMYIQTGGPKDILYMVRNTGTVMERLNMGDAWVEV